MFWCCDCNLRRHMGKHYWLSLSFMQECNLLHPIRVLQDTFLRLIMPIPFFSSSSLSKWWKRITSFRPFWGERKVLAMDSWGCVCCFGYWEEFQSPTLLSSISPCLRHSCLGQKCSLVHSVPMNLFPPETCKFAFKTQGHDREDCYQTQPAWYINVEAEARCVFYVLFNKLLCRWRSESVLALQTSIYVLIWCVFQAVISVLCVSFMWFWLPLWTEEVRASPPHV